MRSRSRFSTLTRIDPKQKAWIRENKNTRTDAGMLDKIINYYRQHHDPQV